MKEIEYVTDFIDMLMDTVTDHDPDNAGLYINRRRAAEMLRQMVDVRDALVLMIPRESSVPETEATPDPFVDTMKAQLVQIATTALKMSEELNRRNS